MAIFTRRDILKSAAASSLVAGSGLSTALTSFAANAAIDTSGYKALVCVFFRGGLDAHDVLLPTDTADYNEFANIRASMLPAYGGARDPARLLPLSNSNHAFPPEYAELHSLYESGDLAVVSNVGPLITPTDANAFNNNTVPLPRALFSHNDQQSTWAALESEGAQFGWGGRFADAVLGAGANANPAFTAISVADSDVFLSGDLAIEYQIRQNGGVVRVNEITNPNFLGSARNDPAAQDLITDHLRAAGFSASNFLENDIAAATARAVDNNAAYSNAFASAPNVAGLPGTRLGNRLRTVAQTIAVRSALGVGRQVFFVSLGGFDSHSNQATNLQRLLSEISGAISGFYQATIDLGVANDVTLFTASDFGRTLATNGDGTDHGWGGHHVVVGGAVRGGEIYGAVPPSAISHSQGIRGGRLVPVTSVEQYAATLGAWFGLDDPALNAALPNLSNFVGRPDFLS